MAICFKCPHLKNSKCEYTKCMSCFKNILNSKFGKCPRGKWGEELPEIK